MKRLVILIVVCVSFLGLAIHAPDKSNNTPNIIIVLSDDHPYQIISAYGSKIAQTPNIDRIANEGGIFQKAYVTNSICGPSRAVILTGKYSHKNGFKDNDFSVFDANQQTFVKLLGQVGYQTAWIGKWHLVNNPKGFGYWSVLPDQGRYYNPEFIQMDSSKIVVNGYASNVIEDKAEEWLDKRDKSKPFCLVVGHKAPHRPWIPDTLDIGRYDHQKFQLPENFYDNYKGRKTVGENNLALSKIIQLDYDLKVDTKEFDKDFYKNDQRTRLKAYYQTVSDDFKAKKLGGNDLTEWKFKRYMIDYLNTSHSVDRNVGRMLDYLDKNKLTENTVVIYLSDQGSYLGEHGWIDKRWMFEESFRTPMVIRYPKVVKPHTSFPQMVLNLDIAPTLLDIAGVSIPKDMQGNSFLPMLSKKNTALHDAIYYHYYEPNHKVPPHLGIKTKRYKLIYFYDKLSKWEFYDLGKDPQEMNNLIDDKKYAKSIVNLRKQLDLLIEKYDDTEAKTILKKI